MIDDIITNWSLLPENLDSPDVKSIHHLLFANDCGLIGFECGKLSTPQTITNFTSVSHFNHPNWSFFVCAGELEKNGPPTSYSYMLLHTIIFTNVEYYSLLVIIIFIFFLTIPTIPHSLKDAESIEHPKYPLVI